MTLVFIVLDATTNQQLDFGKEVNNEEPVLVDSTFASGKVTKVSEPLPAPAELGLTQGAMIQTVWVKGFLP